MSIFSFHQENYSEMSEKENINSLHIVQHSTPSRRPLSAVKLLSENKGTLNSGAKRILVNKESLIKAATPARAAGAYMQVI